ncbi:unnamed protein product [Ectocarpus sp. 4 AP-2014]
MKSWVSGDGTVVVSSCLFGLFWAQSRANPRAQQSLSAATIAHAPKSSASHEIKRLRWIAQPILIPVKLRWCFLMVHAYTTSRKRRAMRASCCAEKRSNTAP